MTLYFEIFLPFGAERCVRVLVSLFEHNYLFRFHFPSLPPSRSLLFGYTLLLLLLALLAFLCLSHADDNADTVAEAHWKINTIKLSSNDIRKLLSRLVCSSYFIIVNCENNDRMKTPTIEPNEATAKLFL